MMYNLQIVGLDQCCAFIWFVSKSQYLITHILDELEISKKLILIISKTCFIPIFQNSISKVFYRTCYFITKIQLFICSDFLILRTLTCNMLVVVTNWFFELTSNVQSVWIVKLQCNAPYPYTIIFVYSQKDLQCNDIIILGTNVA
jgi:hypothetical protein